MKHILLLSSTKFLIKHPSPFPHKSLREMRIAYITTASKGVSDVAYLERTENIFKQNNYNYEELDIDGKNKEWLESYLKDFEAVFVQGGNSFYLLKAIRESGFDSVIKKLLPGGFVYIGASAGSYVACPTIEMAGLGHQDKYNHYGVADLTAMGLVPFLMSVHYSPENKDILKEKIAKTSLPVKILTDDQAILIQDDKVELVGEGEEIKI